MGVAVVKTPLVVKKLFPNYVWDIQGIDKSIFLTFDDGPTPVITNWVLNTLEEYNAKATFFCIGNNIEKYPDIFNNIINKGHHIGNHTYNHIKGWKSSLEAYSESIKQTEAIINSKVSNYKLSNEKLFRPPYGQITPNQGKSLINKNFKIIMWDVLSYDWDSEVSEEKCLQNVINKAKNGSIIVFHDSKKASKNMMYALPKVLDYFTKKGYHFKPLF